MSKLLPPWLPDWNGAEELARSLDVSELRAVVDNLIDLVFAEDSVFLDLLPESLESALISPLGTLVQVCESQAGAVEIVVASRLVRRSVAPYLSESSEELRLLIESLPE